MSRSLTGLNVIPGAGKTSIGVGQTAQFQAQGVFTESGHATTTEDLTSSVTWQSANPAIATINSSGLATGISAGTTTISATTHGQFGTVVGTSDVTVAAGGTSSTRTLNSLTVIPGAQTLSTTGQTAQFIAIANYSAAPLTVNVTAQATWRTSDVSVAKLSTNAGQAVGVGVGTATITALYTAAGTTASGSSTVTIASAPTSRALTALTITPGSQTITSTGQTAQLIAIGTYSKAPTSADLSSTATWESSDPQVATVSATGLVTGIGVGSATITALASDSNGPVIASAAITVSASPSGRELTGLTVIPTTQTVNAAGETTQFLAIGTYSAAPLTVDLTRTVTWQSSDVLVAQVDASGLATAVGFGETTITALSTDTNGSVQTATGVIQNNASSGSVSLPTLAIYLAGLGSGSVSSGIVEKDGTVSWDNVISCSSSSPSSASCTGTYPLATTVILHAVAGSNSVFDGWSQTCVPSDASGVALSPADYTSAYCTVVMSNNESVGAIFDPQ